MMCQETTAAGFEAEGGWGIRKPLQRSEIKCVADAAHPAVNQFQKAVPDGPRIVGKAECRRADHDEHGDVPRQQVVPELLQCNVASRETVNVGRHRYTTVSHRCDAIASMSTQLRGSRPSLAPFESRDVRLPHQDIHRSDSLTPQCGLRTVCRESR